jgi:gamma-glutamyltranspeptidase/glutathione hydrolase
MGNRNGLSTSVLILSLVLATSSATAENPAPLAEGKNGVVVGTSSPLSVAAGLEVLKKGGTAADAAVAISLAQVVECGGSYVSHAGILGMVYFDAATGKVHSLNAAYNTPREEKDPLTIPGRAQPSGRTALIPGFMAGVEAAHDRFGKLPRKEVFEPAVQMAEAGIKVSSLLARFLQTKAAVLSRRPETKRIFTNPEGHFYIEGERFRQAELAQTLKHVAEEGATYMYTGPWAEHFVAEVRQEGGKITMEDMKAYQVIWEDPIGTDVCGHKVCVPGFSSQGGVTMIEALHLIEVADLPKLGPVPTTPKSLFWLMQISHCQILGFLDEAMLKDYQGLDLTPRSRVKRETAAGIWERMQKGTWTFSAKLRPKEDMPLNHSDGVVVVDKWGNVAALTHSINTALWGDTGIFVDGVSIPDSANFQQQAIKRVGPGRRLPDPMCPLIVLKGDKPVLGSSAIGGGLHQRTLQELTGVLAFGTDPQAALEMPAFLLPAFSAGAPTAQVEKGQFDAKFLDDVRALGQPIKEVSVQEAGAFRGYWVGVQIVPESNMRRAIGTRKAPLPSVAAGY